MNIPVGCRVHLLGITSTDGGDSIGKEDATSHNINDIGKLDDLRIEETAGGDASHFQDAVAENPLVGEVMDGIDGGGAGKEGIIAINGMHPVGYNAGLPIVAVYDIGRPVECAHRFESGPAK